MCLSYLLWCKMHKKAGVSLGVVENRIVHGVRVARVSMHCIMARWGPPQAGRACCGPPKRHLAQEHRVAFERWRRACDDSLSGPRGRPRSSGGCWVWLTSGRGRPSLDPFWSSTSRSLDGMRLHRLLQRLDLGLQCLSDGGHRWRGRHSHRGSKDPPSGHLSHE